MDLLSTADEVTPSTTMDGNPDQNQPGLKSENVEVEADHPLTDENGPHPTEIDLNYPAESALEDNLKEQSANVSEEQSCHSRRLEGRSSRDASSVISYVQDLERTIQRLERTVASLQAQINHPHKQLDAEGTDRASVAAESRDTSSGDVSSEAQRESDENSDQESDEGASENDEKTDDEEALDLRVYREIKIRNDRPYRREIFEDKGDFSLQKISFGDKGSAPLTCRRVFSEAGNHLKTVLKIQSQRLLGALKESLPPSRSEQYNTLFSFKARVYRPYVLFFHNRRILIDAVGEYRDAGEPQKSSLLQLLLDFLKEDMPLAWKKLDELEAGGCTRILFKEAWLLYQPGTTVYTERSGKWEAYKVENVVAQQLPSVQSLKINAYYLGLHHGSKDPKPARKVLYQPPFAGERHISNFKVIPRSHAVGHDLISTGLVTRGKAFRGFIGQPAYRQYAGTAWPTTSSTAHVRVVIDYFTSSGPAASDFDVDSDSSNHCRCSNCVWKYAGLASHADEHTTASDFCPNDATTKPTKIAAQQSNQETTEEMTSIFYPSHVLAFSLKHKTWKEVEVDRISEIPDEEDPFKRLILEDSHKTVVESMVETQMNNRVLDIIKEKGRGLVILLHGAPGTGKTLTAECVAAEKRKPLYMVTCGDLGTDPDMLEERLQEIFLRAVNWEAILLLDEADVFLQERDFHDLNRNALVSVFLRHIEYYDGVLFLTTNRPGKIDEAFQSRIHITLGLPTLDFNRQKKIWQIFINRLTFNAGNGSDGKRTAEDRKKTREMKIELLRFVKNDLENKLRENNYQMNGRQIRNCIRAASAIANKGDRSVTKDDILSVINLGKQFRDYITQVHRMTEEERARALGVRFPDSKSED